MKPEQIKHFEAFPEYVQQYLLKTPLENWITKVLSGEPRWIYRGPSETLCHLDINMAGEGYRCRVSDKQAEDFYRTHPKHSVDELRHKTIFERLDSLRPGVVYHRAHLFRDRDAWKKTGCIGDGWRRLKYEIMILGRLLPSDVLCGVTVKNNGSPSSWGRGNETPDLVFLNHDFPSITRYIYAPATSERIVRQCLRDLSTR